MPEDPQKPKTLDELEKELDADALKPGVVSAESRDDVPAPTAVDDREDTIEVSDTALKQAATEAEAEDDSGDPEIVADSSLHIELRPKAQEPFFKRQSFWTGAIISLVVLLILAWFIRPSRLVIVNTLGLRTTVSVTTSTTAEDAQPSSVVKNVTISIGNDTITSNDEGEAESAQPYGDIHVSAQKSGYEPATADLLVDFDPFFYLLGGQEADAEARTANLQLKAVGVPLKFKVTDWLSDTPITTGSFAVGDIVAKPDDQGLVSLRLPASEVKEVVVKSALGGQYIDTETKVSLGTLPTLSFVPTGSHYYISKRSGQLVVYGSSLNGAEPAVIMNAHANETAAMSVTYNPEGTYVAIATTRDNKKDSHDALLQKLYVYNVKTKKLTSVDEGRWFNFVDWSGDKLIYTVGERLPAKTAVTQRLVSMNVVSMQRRDLSTASSFGVVRVALGEVLYAYNFASSEEGFSTSPELRVIPSNGGTEKTLGYNLKQLTQPSAQAIAYQTASGDWHEYTTNTGQAKNSSPPTSIDRTYVSAPSADGQWRLYIDRIDGVTTLVARNSGDGKEVTLHSNAGIRGPIHWVGNSVVFRVADGSQTADYVVSLKGGAPKKITDVTLPVSSFVAPAGYFGLH